MKFTCVKRLTVMTMLLVLLSSCGPIDNPGTTSSDGNNDGGTTAGAVTVSILYGSEKEDWLEPLEAEFNAATHTTASGSRIIIEATPMGSVESANSIIATDLQPTVWSPASSVYIPLAQADWAARHGSALFTREPNDLVLSPVIIAMWRPMAEALGWPDEPIGWADIAALAASEEGWAAYGFPEWGDFKFGHTHPYFSNSGVVSVLAEAYAGAGKQRNLTVADLNDPDLQAFMEGVEGSIIHYGSSTGFFARRMFNGGPSYLSAAVLYENLVAAQEARRLAGEVAQLPVVAIYPAEGTFWTNNPYVILETPWVSDEQREAAEIFEAFLLDTPQQRRAIEFGFRPADPAIPLDTPLDTFHGVDPTQPQTILQVPEAQVIREAQELWRRVKRPVDLALVVDISGSMAGQKIGAVRVSVARFIGLLADRDRLRVTVFNDHIIEISPLSELGPKREDVTRRVSGLVETGETALYDAIQDAYTNLEANGDPDSIRAIVVLTDGQDTQSSITLDQLINQFEVTVGEEGGNAIKIFTIAYGDTDAAEQEVDIEVLLQIAEQTGGRQYDGSPTTISEVYEEIALFF